MADFSDSRLNTGFPPGRVDYPTQMNKFVDHAELFATAIENGRAFGSPSILDTLGGYAKSTLADDIDGSGVYKFTGMIAGTGLLYPTTPTPDTPTENAKKDYVTRGQLVAVLASPPSITDTNFNLPFDVPYSQMRVADATDFGTFEYNITAHLDNTTYLYPPVFNATYKIDWSTESIVVFDLEGAGAPTPVNGDRIRIININPGEFYGIRSNSIGINGITNETIYFGSNVVHSGLGTLNNTTVLYDINANFTGVSPGDLVYHINEDIFVEVTAYYSSIALGTEPVSNWQSQYQIGDPFSYVIYDLVYTTQSGWLFKHVLTG